MLNRDRIALAELSLIAVCAVWGLTFVMVQDAVALLPVTTFLAYRFLGALAVVLVFVRKPLAGLDRAGWRAGLAMGAFLTAGYLTQTLGLERTSASNAGFITGLFVVLTPVFGTIVLRERPERSVWLAAGVAAVGLYLMTGSSREAHLSGDALIFVTACAFAGHILVTGRAAPRHHPGALLAVQLGLCGMLSLVLAAAAGDLQVPSQGSVWVALAVTAVLASAAAFFLQTWAQQRIPSARTALILGSEPVFAGLFAYLIQGERLDAWGWLGAGLIMAAVLGVELRRVRIANVRSI